jgi:hypothetical protein
MQNDITPMPDELAGQMASRADFDRFERALKVKRAFAPVMTLALLALAVGGAWHWLRTASDGSVESEPNEAESQATRLLLGTPISGTMGASPSIDRSDYDYYVVDAPAGPLSIQLSAVPDLNLALHLWEPGHEGKQTEVRLFLDDLGAGERERVDAYQAQGGRLILRVSEAAHYEERPRGPREKSGTRYTLLVSKLEAPFQAEREPNDTPQAGSAYEAHRAIVGYAGAVVPEPPYRVGEKRPNAPYLSAVDFLFARNDAGAKSVQAIVVAPIGGKLSVLDAAAYETWETAVANATTLQGKTSKPPPATAVGARPERLTLTQTARGFGVRAQSLEGAAGAAYSLAFIHEGPNGLAGAIDLGAMLSAAGRIEEGRRVLQLAADAFPQSDQTAAVRDLLGQMPQAPK